MYNNWKKLKKLFMKLNNQNLKEDGIFLFCS